MTDAALSLETQAAAARPHSGRETVCDSTPSRIRTYDLRIRSPLLYPLSYGREMASG
jgi:hypothetical protein